MRSQKNLIQNETVITENAILAIPYTRTVIVKFDKYLNSKIFSDIQQLKHFLPQDLPINNSKFKNCLSFKYHKKSIGIYTNLTLKITGSSVNYCEDCREIVTLLKLHQEKYQIECVMINWSVKISDKPIDLVKVAELINNSQVPNLIAYFLKGIFLIVKYKKDCGKPIHTFNEGDVTEIVKTTALKVSVSLFTTGKCIVSGPTEKICAELLLILKKIIVSV